MPTGKTCGNCAYFCRVPGWGDGRNGLCDEFDYNCHADSSRAKRCPGYRRIKYDRVKTREWGERLIAEGMRD